MRNADQSRAKEFWKTVHVSDGEPDFHDETLEGQLRAYLWGSRIKATDARIDIIKLLSKESYPLTVQAITDKLGPSYNFRTVYRALDVLAEAELVNRVDFGHDHAHYEIALGRKHHHHAVCTSCGEVEDVMDCATGKIDEMAHGLKKFKHIRSHSLEFFGLCRKCEVKDAKHS